MRNVRFRRLISSDGKYEENASVAQGYWFRGTGYSAFKDSDGMWVLVDGSSSCEVFRFKLKKTCKDVAGILNSNSRLRNRINGVKFNTVSQKPTDGWFDSHDRQYFFSVLEAERTKSALPKYIPKLSETPNAYGLIEVFATDIRIGEQFSLSAEGRADHLYQRVPMPAGSSKDAMDNYIAMMDEGGGSVKFANKHFVYYMKPDRSRFFKKIESEIVSFLAF